MSEIRLFFNPLNAKSMVSYDVEPGTLLIDFLQEHYPVGFQGSLVTFVGTEQLAVENLDYPVKEEDSITMLIMPAGPVAAYLTSAAFQAVLISAAVSAAIGFAINFLFAPEAPKAFGRGEESPTYSIAPTRNQARLGEPLACHFGTVSFPPDYAAAPYAYFVDESNDQYVDELLCLGVGEFTVDESQIYIGETPVTALEPGAVQYWLYGPDDHQQTFGVIEADIAAKLANSSAPYPFKENVFTSPELESVEFFDDVSDVVSAPVAFNGQAFAANIDPANGIYEVGRITGFADTETFVPGDNITIANSLNNNGDLVVGSVIDNGDGTLTVFEEWGANRIAQENPLICDYTVNTTLNQMIGGPYRAQKPGQTIDEATCDILFPAGLMHINSSGDQQYKDVAMQFRFQRIDETTGAPIDPPVVVDKTYRGRQRHALRSTVSSGPLTPGAYEVEVERITEFSTNGRDPEVTTWVGLKGHIVNDTTQTAYGPVTLMAIRLKATNTLGAAARNRIRVTATRVLPDLVGSDSSNPITAFKNVWTDSEYGMGRNLDELDQIALNSLEIDYAAPGGPSFNGTFDQKSTGWESLEQIVSIAGARVVQQSALTTVIQDERQVVRRAMYSMANIVPDTLEILYTFDPAGDFDGIKIEYRNEKFDPVYVTYPSTATNPENFNLFGCTDATYAGEFAVYLWNVRNLRRKVVSFETELEGLIPIFGDRIGISHEMPDWGQSGVVVETISSNEIRVDQALDWEFGSFIVLRDATGSPTEPIFVRRGATEDIVVFSSPPPITVFSPNTREPTMYSFGNQYTVIKDFIVSSVEPQSETRVLMRGHVYDPDIYTGAPPHMGG